MPLARCSREAVSLRTCSSLTRFTTSLLRLMCLPRCSAGRSTKTSNVPTRWLARPWRATRRGFTTPVTPTRVRRKGRGARWACTSGSFIGFAYGASHDEGDSPPCAPFSAIPPFAPRGRGGHRRRRGGLLRRPARRGGGSARRPAGGHAVAAPEGAHLRGRTLQRD